MTRGTRAAPPRVASPVMAAAEQLARDLVVDEDADLVRWRDDRGALRETGFHDYAALYEVPGLYEAVYYVALRGEAPQLLAAALADVVPPAQRPAHRVLDVGAGTGGVGEALAVVGFAEIAGTDLEPASARALRRDRSDVYGAVRALDLVHPDPEDEAWLRAVAPTVATVAGAVGYGHLPVEALDVVTDLLPVGGLLALTVAPGLESDPELSGHADLLLGPRYDVVLRRDGVHRLRPDGTPLPVLALVLRREETA